MGDNLMSNTELGTKIKTVDIDIKLLRILSLFNVANDKSFKELLQYGTSYLNRRYVVH